MKKISILAILFAFLLVNCKKEKELNPYNDLTTKNNYYINSEKDLEQFKVKSNSVPDEKGVTPNFTIYHFKAGNIYINAPIDITNKSKYIYEGEGENTNIFANSAFDMLFRIGSHVNDLTIRNMKITRYTPSIPTGIETNTAAVGSHEGITDIYDIKIYGLTIENMPIGISVGNGSTGYDNVVIRDNHIIHSAYRNDSAGQGYGIHCGGANYVLIENNIIEYSGRHSIYVTKGLYDITVKNNLILNHCIGQSQENLNCGAISIARTKNVLVEGNKILNSRTVSIAIENNDDGYGYPPENIIVINNDILGARNKGIWINTHIPHLLYGNKIEPYLYGGIIGFESISCEGGSSFYPTLELQPNELVYLNGYYYQMFNNTLKSIYPDKLISCLQNVADRPSASNFQDWWNSQVINTSPGNWYNFEAMESNPINSKLYLVQNGVYHEINPNDFSYTYSSQVWFNVKGIASAQGNLITVQASPNYPNSSAYLHNVSPGTFSYIYNTTNYTNYKGICSWNNRVFMYRDNILYEINPSDLSTIQAW